MKKIGTYTCRGQIAENTENKIILFDGKFTTGYRIREFKIMHRRANSGTVGWSILYTESGAVDTTTMDIDMADNRQVGWCVSDLNGFFESLIDEDNMIVEDLYIAAISDASVEPQNYIITLDKYEFPDSVGALAMVRNRSQA